MGVCSIRLRFASVLVLSAGLAWWAAGLNGTFTQEPGAALVARSDAALARAQSFLISRQAADGAFRSDTYGAMKDDLTLTGHVLEALQCLPPERANANAVKRGLAKLRDGIDDRGRVKGRLAYPVYTLSLATLCLARDQEDLRSRAAMEAFAGVLRQHQLGPHLGWNEEDANFGGWGYSGGLPWKDEARREGGATVDANLSSTVYALEALRATGLKETDPLIQAGLRFVGRCQNWPLQQDRSPGVFDDGGFFFSPTDAGKNKAGRWGQDEIGRVRFVSYGTMSCDGLRALALCGETGPRRTAAAQWIRSRFDVERQPGHWTEENRVFRQGMYFYYARSLAMAGTSDGRCVPAEWAARLTTAILDRQQPDGSWSSGFTDAKEDDPLVATAQAIRALAECQRLMRIHGS